MDKKNIEKICNSANKIFIEESLSGYPKYKYLPHWLKNKSIYLSRERQKLSTNFKVYKRGTIVYTDFGVNVGYELSGNHFAIVLNNYDNPKNGVLTVVPISSKENKNYIPVGAILASESIKQFASQSDKLELMVKIHILVSIHYGLLKKETMDTDLLEIADKGEKISIQEALKKANKYGFTYNSTTSVIDNLQKIASDALLYRKVFDAYRKYTKLSYVMPNNIQSISKHRIKRINKFDPSGNMKVSKSVLDEIDKAFLKKYTDIQSSLK